ncbi:hypothetical protein C0J45_21881 [Silurus meridionalis]|nr:hypothetical protein C0J45_21881 [Silurus meridionalis]
MGQFEDRLTEEVRRHKHLYDPSSKHYKHSDVMFKSWKEIGRTLGEDPEVCMKKWKAIRDKFVRLKKKIKNRNGGDSGPDEEKEPEYCMRLSWLNGFIKHRDTKSDAGEWRRCAVQRATCSDDDDDDSACTEASSVSQSAKKRKRVATDTRVEVADKLAIIHQKMMRCSSVVSQLSAVDESRRSSDEFFTFAQAVADSLRKLPPDRVEATKVKLFTVLGEAHKSAGL